MLSPWRSDAVVAYRHGTKAGMPIVSRSQPQGSAPTSGGGRRVAPTTEIDTTETSTTPVAAEPLAIDPSLEGSDPASGAPELQSSAAAAMAGETSMRGSFAHDSVPTNGKHPAASFLEARPGFRPTPLAATGEGKGREGVLGVWT
jgi:hypothetical protein